MSKIPIQNVYYLLCYAWDQMRAGEIVETGTAGQTELVNLFGTVLANGTERVLKQGLDRGYVTHSEDTARPRGQIDFDTSVKRALLPRGRVHCRYDRLSRDVLHNRILKSTLRSLTRAEKIDKEELRPRLLSLVRRFGEVSDVPLRHSLFQRVQLHSGNAFYRFLLHVCSLVEQNLVPTEGGAGRQFRDFLRNEATMWKLFEDFVYNFYDHEQDRYNVSAPQIHWKVSGPVPEALPNMRTDVVLQSTGGTIILDTKYSKDALKAHYGKEVYESKHLYQLYAYLKNAESKGQKYREAEGILLYPTTGVHLNDEFQLERHRVRLCSIDLSQEWREIHEDLLALTGLDR
ncbi:5-methylcytosine restriction system specificity protein McrC [Salinibacter ruber]|uniref:5-methylcytosine restriction system specificity protein McrC n=1 Tax=Salinibacter ruber TaxID=146919 RepID=UPI0021698891|nr:5-methylcytosine-specific restriction enzyme subunit McrC [Salinibacter ruber]